MADGNLLFTLEYEKFVEIVNGENWFNLQHEFRIAGGSLSHSFLIWQEESGNTWLLADFETTKTYSIETKKAAATDSQATVEILEQSSQKEQLIGLKDPKSIFSHLQQSPKGTHEGLIDFVTRIDLGTVDLERLKRTDLSGAGFSFEFVYHDLSTIHKTLHEILTSPRESLLDLSRNDFQQFTNYLDEFYKNIEQIGNFEARDERPREIHSSLLLEISNFCENVKNTLNNAITYLRSKKVEQLEDQVKTTLTDTEEKFNTTINTETERLQKFGEEAQEKEGKRQENFEQLYIQLQNQLTEKPISQYKSIFETQAKNHGVMAWVWLIVSGLLAVGFGIIFWKLLTDIGSLASQENQLSMILSNLFAKGFYLSLIFLFLNRTIKNFAAEKHLEVINTHRQNALETFDIFVAAAEGNRETRDAVLLAATKAIFDANQSGYLSAKTSGSDSANPVQQIIKEVLPSKSSDKSE